MQNGTRTTMTTHRPASARPYADRSKRGASNGARPEFRGSETAQRSYERYLALAQAQVLAGDRIGAENYYQHAEHFLRSMSPDRETI